MAGNSEKAMVGSGLQKAVEGDGDGRKVVCNGGCMGMVSFKGAPCGVVGGLERAGLEGLKEAQVFEVFSSEVAAHLSNRPLEGSKVLISKETCRVGHHSKKVNNTLVCVAQGGGEGSVNLRYGADSKNTPMESWFFFRASFASRGHDFHHPELSPPVFLRTSTGMALMAEAIRHPRTIFFSVSSLETQATSSPSLSRNGLGLEGSEVDFAIDPVGEGSSPLKMVLVDDTSVEFEEVGVRPIEVAVGKEDKE